jgi:6-pyruvoyltetrahydropterin/6-carboxytetrahydropterin synthase
MTITKHFKFYAAHRNEEIGGKCASIHGHRYGIAVTVEEPRNGSITMLFDEIEQRVKPLLDRLDHSLLLHAADPARDMLLATGACRRVYEVPFPTSAENMAEHLLTELRATGLNVVELALQETDTSVVTVKP